MISFALFLFHFPFRLDSYSGRGNLPELLIRHFNMLLLPIATISYFLIMAAFLYISILHHQQNQWHIETVSIANPERSSESLDQLMTEKGMNEGRWQAFPALGGKPTAYVSSDMRYQPQINSTSLLNMATVRERVGLCTDTGGTFHLV